MTVIYRYLDCGDLHMGLARVRCEDTSIPFVTMGTLSAKASLRA